MEWDSVSWSEEKDELLREKFGIGFARVMQAFETENVLLVRGHPNQQVYGHQPQVIVKIDGYAWIVPFVTNEDGIFLKTMFPSRVETKRLLGVKK